MTALKENLEHLEEAIAAACRKAGRRRDEIELMAVSKTYSAATVAEAAELGLSLFGESRVQEFGAKVAKLAQLRESTPQATVKHDLESSECQGTTSVVPKMRRYRQGALVPEASSTDIPPRDSRLLASGKCPIRVHLIGHLQSNKAQRAVELFDAIDSLDSLRLAERLNEAAGKLDKRLPVLIEVKLSPEETKVGLEPESLEAAELL